MRFLDEVFDEVHRHSRHCEELRADAEAIDASLADRLPVFGTFRNSYLRMASKLESHCAEVERWMLLAYDATEIARRRRSA